MTLFLAICIGLFVVALGTHLLQRKTNRKEDLLSTMQKKDWDQADAFLEAAAKTKPKESWMVKKEREFQAMDIDWNVRKHLTMQLICAALGFVAGWWLLKAPLLIAIATGASTQIPNWFVKRKLAKNRASFDHQYRNALVRLAALTRASASIQQGFWELANSKDCGDRVRKEFYLAFADMNYGKTADEALAQMAIRTGSEDVRMTALLVRIQRVKGGNLVELLEGVQQAISTRAQQKRKMQTMTTQQMGQANLLTSLPFAIFLLFSAVNPSYYGDFLITPIGQLLFLICVGMILFGKKLMQTIIGE